MRLLLLTAFLSLFTLALCWEKEDHEIFDLVSALEGAEGKGTTFYSWLEVPSTASSSEIGKAYRKKSITLHPDKNAGVPGSQERFARLGVVSQILRNEESRKRYDFFYKNGVPKWRGTGYYYARFRPGLGSVLVFLTILSSGLQYIIARFNQTKDLARVERFVKLGRAAARAPVVGKRKVRVPLVGDGTDARDASGRMVDLVVEGDDVFMVDAENQLHPLDESMAPMPRVTDTWAISLARSLYETVLAKTTKGSTTTSESEESSTEEATTTTTPPNGTDKPRVVTDRRRKPVKKNK